MTSPADFTAETWQALGKAFSSLPKTAKLYNLVLGWLCCSFSIGAPKFDDTAFGLMKVSLPTHVLTKILRAYTQRNDENKTCANLYVSGGLNGPWLEPDDDSGMSLSYPISDS